MVRSYVYPVIVSAFLAAGAHATPFEIPIDETASTVTVRLCLLGDTDCDQDASAVDGTFVIRLDGNTPPEAVTLHDFDLQLLDTIDLYIPVFLGDLSATGTNLRMYSATPGVPFGPVPIVDGAFSFVGVPTLLEGTIAYNAGGLVCIALQAAGLPCTDTINLADQGAGVTDFDGTIVVSEGVATLTTNPSIETPLDPDNPDLGTLSIWGTVAGSAPAPADKVPAASSLGLTVLALLLLGVGAAVIARRVRRSVR